MNEFYTDYSEYIGNIFPGRKVQKISVNIGAGCPNRDGTIGTGGCIYCNNASFTPHYCLESDPVTVQIEKGKHFFSRKYPDMKYLAYFQSYTNTYKMSVEELEKLYSKALACDDVIGLIVGTRPDCISQEVIGLLSQLNKQWPVFVELGAETMHDRTLRLINRGHTSEATVKAVECLADAEIHAGVHLIAGLPDESENDIISSVKQICSLPVESIKLHHLQVLKGTALDRMIQEGKMKIKTFSLDNYLDLCVDIINIVPRRVAIERFLASSPPDMVISPKWGIKNYEFTNMLINKLRSLNKFHTDEKDNMVHTHGNSPEWVSIC